MTDTTAETVDRLAGICARGDDAQVWSVAAEIAATLRALAAERDAADLTCETAMKAVTRANAERDAAQARLRACFRAWATLHNTLNCIIHEEDNDPPDIANAIRIARQGLDEARREMDAVGIRAALAGEPQR